MSILRAPNKTLAIAGWIAVLCSPCNAATITGSVRGVDGAPFQGAFVEAQNTKTRITVSVLSDSCLLYTSPSPRDS